MNPQRVLILAADPLVRAGLAALLAGRDDCTVRGQAAPGEDLERLLDVYRPDVILWDAGYDPDLGLALAERDAQAVPLIALLPDASAAPALWAIGARGLLLRSASAGQLAAAIQAVGAGLLAVDPALARGLPLMRPPGPTEALTGREIEVLERLAGGLSNRAIAYALGISEHTVKFHLNAILSKLGAQSRTEAVVIAIRLGLIAV